jgi:hypothetical protein
MQPFGGKYRRVFSFGKISKIVPADPADQIQIVSKNFIAPV